MAITVPEIGRWYRLHDGTDFEVVAVDALEGAIEIQYYDGTIEELEPETWYTLRPELSEPPEDWSGSVDVNYEDLRRDKHPHVLDWMTELDSIDLRDDTELAGTD